MKNWKTFLCACITAFFAFVLFDPQWFSPLIVSVAKFGAAGGLVAFGLFSKDHDVTGGSITQPTVPNPPTLTEDKKG
jgi:hypothetical protein